jgi:hypothetical protein
LSASVSGGGRRAPIRRARSITALRVIDRLVLGPDEFWRHPMILSGYITFRRHRRYQGMLFLLTANVNEIGWKS